MSPRWIATVMWAALAAQVQAAPAACPPGQQESPIIFKGYEGCNPIGKYYVARGQKSPDWTGVLQCATQDRNDAVLMMMYANGLGVKRDIDRAIAHACRIDSAPMELKLRVEHLQAMKAGTDSKPIDLCDDATSGLMGGFCADVAERARKSVRDGALAQQTKGYTAIQRERYTALQKAVDAFAERSSRDETDLSGTARAAFVIQARAAIDDIFLADVRGAELGKLPRGTEQTYTAADKALNDVYRKVMALPTGADGQLKDTTVTKEGIRAAQRTWLKYRDAWAAFGTTRYPAIPAAAWKQRLTERRTAQLKEWLR